MLADEEPTKNVRAAQDSVSGNWGKQLSPELHHLPKVIT